MKRFLVFTVLGFGAWHVSIAQNCAMAIKDGAKSTILFQSFTNPLAADPKFMKAKDEQKQLQIDAYNAQVMSGTLAPASTTSMQFSIAKKDIPTGVEYKIGYKVGEVTYYSHVACSNDTIYSFRNREPIMVGTADNPLGYSLQGPTVYPMNMKVGDILPVCEDLGFLFPTSTDMMVKKSVFSHMNTTSSSENGFYVDSYTGQSGVGPYTKTKTSAVFKLIDVQVRQTLSFSSHAYQNMNAHITGEEQVTVGGVAYKAFVIESESWSKMKMDVSYDSEDAAVNKEQEAFALKVQNKMAKQAMRKQFTNKLGYMVSYSKTWFVPQLGSAVKSIAYDMHGGISSIMTTTEVL